MNKENLILGIGALSTITVVASLLLKKEEKTKPSNTIITEDALEFETVTITPEQQKKYNII